MGGKIQRSFKTWTATNCANMRTVIQFQSVEYYVQRIRQRFGCILEWGVNSWNMLTWQYWLDSNKSTDILLKLPFVWSVYRYILRWWKQALIKKSVDLLVNDRHTLCQSICKPWGFQNNWKAIHPPSFFHAPSSAPSIFTLFIGFLFFHGATATFGPGPPHCRGYTITLRHTTCCRPPLDR